MTKAGLQQLSEELGVRAPERLSELNEAELSLLTEAVKRLKKRQDVELNSALENALSHVPALLRGAVRKILFG